MARKLTLETLRKTCARIKYSTAAGPDGITPWLFAQCILNSLRDQLGNVMVRIGNRAARGDYSEEGGSAEAIGLLLGLWKNQEQTDVRPIAIASARRRILCKAFAATLKKDAKLKLGAHQAGVHTTGFEAVVHGIRDVLVPEKFRGKVLLCIDAKNAFNAANRATMLAVNDVMFPSMSGLATWLYATSSVVMTTNGHDIVSDTGV